MERGLAIVGKGLAVYSPAIDIVGGSTVEKRRGIAGTGGTLRGYLRRFFLLYPQDSVPAPQEPSPVDAPQAAEKKRNPEKYYLNEAKFFSSGNCVPRASASIRVEENSCVKIRVVAIVLSLTLPSFLLEIADCR